MSWALLASVSVFLAIVSSSSSFLFLVRDGKRKKRISYCKLLKQTTKKKRKKKELTFRNQDEKQAENGAGKL